MSVFICGDTHWGYDHTKLTIRRWPEQKELTKDDYVIVTGDFGLLWDYKGQTREEVYWTKELQARRFTTLFVDGNHENFTRLEALEEIDMFGGKVGVVADGIYHLKRGYIYTICGEMFFCFGGALSTDKEHRVIDMSWWAQELPSKAEENFALENLDKVNWKVDHIITHAAPSSIVGMLGYSDRINDPVANFLEFILCESIKFDSWHFGHYHDDKVFHGKFHLHYDNEPLKVV